MSRASLLLLALAAAAAPAAALDDASDAVTQLTDKTFDAATKQGVWLVEVYAPWCGHCKNAAPEVKAAAKLLAGVGHIAVVDGDKAGSATCVASPRLASPRARARPHSTPAAQT